MPTADCGFSGSPNGRGSDSLVTYGPTLGVCIGFDPSYDPAGSSHPRLNDYRFPALVDTGATFSCLDANLAIEMGLPAVDQQQMVGIGGAHRANVYLAQIYVPDLDFVQYGRFAGVNLSEGGLWHRALIGRSFLRAFTLTYEGKTGSVTISND